MRGKLLIFIHLFLLSWYMSKGSTGDSLRYLTTKDTIFISVGEYDEKFFVHQIAEKQTLYSLAKFYGLSLEALYHYNPYLRDKVLSISDPIKIPIPNRAILRYRNALVSSREYVPICYRVKPGDNLFRISKIFFRMPIDTIMQRNGLYSHNLQPGYILQMGWMSTEGIPEHFQRSRLSYNDKMAMKFEELKLSEKKGERLEQGVAFWQKNSKQEVSDLYALHRRAPINTLIAIENPMKQRTVYAKVIGRIPDTAYGREVIVVLSPAVARQLGARDARFFVRVRYLK